MNTATRSKEDDDRTQIVLLLVKIATVCLNSQTYQLIRGRIGAQMLESTFEFPKPRPRMSGNQHVLRPTQSISMRHAECDAAFSLRNTMFFICLEHQDWIFKLQKQAGISHTRRV
jgi:hypothetical protein